MSFSLLWYNDKEVSKLEESLFSDLKITKLLEKNNFSDEEIRKIKYLNFSRWW